MAEIDAQKRHIREVLLYRFREGKSPTQAAREICEGYGQGAVHTKTASKWFKRFREGQFSLDDRPRSRRQMVIDSNVVRRLVDENPQMTVEEMAEDLGMAKRTVFDHLKRLNFVKLVDVFAPCELDARQLGTRVNACVSLFHRANNEVARLFLSRVVTGDEKWIIYNNPEDRRSWRQPGTAPLAVVASGLHPKKLIPCVWWDYQAVSFSQRVRG